MAPLSHTPTCSTLPRALLRCCCPNRVRQLRGPCLHDGDRETRCPEIPHAPVEASVEAPVSLLVVMVAELTPNESRVGSRKGHEYKEPDSLSREKKEGWWREREGELRQAKQL